MSKRTIQRTHARNLKRTGRRAAIGVSAAIGAGALLAPAADAASFTVTNLDDSGAGSLRDAVTQANAAGDPDIITFQSGLNGQIDLLSSIGVTNPVDIEGPGANQVTIDGGDATQLFVLGVATAGDPVTISGLTLANGYSGPGDGGALSAFNTSLTLSSVTVRDSATISSGKYSGGGVSFAGSDTWPITVTDSTFTGNDSAKYGGGLHTTDSGDVTISGSTFSDNAAGQFGGGMGVYDASGNVTIEETTVTGNDGGTGDGGGIWIEDIYGGKTGTIQNSTITDNTTTRAGGGISFGENFFGETKVVNSTVTGNSAAFGGGIQFADLDAFMGVYGTFSLENSTVTDNEATDSGGGVFQGYSNGNTSESALTISSSALSGNTAANNGPEISQSANLSPGTTLDVGNSLVDDTSGFTYTADPTGSNVTGVGAGLGALADNGGPTETQLPTATSPVVDAGLANGLTTDQRGLARTVDYPDVPATHGSDGTDIGAAELVAPPPPPDTSVTDPFLSIDSPQVEGKKIKVAVQAGAGEAVTAEVYGKIFVGKGNAVMKSGPVAIDANGRATLTVVPKTKKSQKRIVKALKNGRKVRAKLKGKLVDANANEYTKDLEADLKPKKKPKK